MENPVAIQLPEADSLPDGFIDSSAEPVTRLYQETQVTDYKEDKQIEVDSKPNLIVNVFQLCEEYCKDESDAGLPNSVSENVIRKSEHEMAPSTEGNKHKITEKSTKQGVETLAAHVKRTLILEGSETTRKVFSNSFVLLIIKTVFLLN
ncbi:hypothetical protein R6Q59_008831 [Mikania micrantha]